MLQDTRALGYACSGARVFQDAPRGVRLAGDPAEVHPEALTGMMPPC